MALALEHVHKTPRELERMMAEGTEVAEMLAFLEIRQDQAERAREEARPQPD